MNDTIIKRIGNLLSVKSLVTLVLTVVFAVMTVRQAISQDFMTIYDFGHTGIVESVAASTITAIEGNTSPGEAGSQSNGGGVFRRKRSKTLVTAYIRAFDDLDKEDDMDGKEIFDKLNEYMKTQSLPNDAKIRKEYEEAVRMGITDGTSPCQLVPRWQAALMAKRAREGK